jgi:hypothetical protein
LDGLRLNGSALHCRRDEYIVDQISVVTLSF